MNGPELLKQNVDILKTRMGACFLGDRAIFRGHNLHTELKDMDWLELYLFGITGRRFSKEQIELMHAMYVYTSYPDPRIWNNRVAALAGSSRSTGSLAVAASLAVSDATIYGGGIYGHTIDFLHRANKELLAKGNFENCVREELSRYRRIAGYGRPVISEDERNAPLMKKAESVGLADGTYVSLAYKVEEFLINGRWRWKLNAGGLYAAFTADFGMSPTEANLFLFPLFMGGMMPCFIEATERPEGTLFPLSCSHLLYEGQVKREWRQD